MICRWRHTDTSLILDAMPKDPSILGFENRWQAPAATEAITQVLPSGVSIRAAAPAHLVATKIEAFLSRGEEDFLASRDLEDIITLIDGREELVAETRQANPELRSYLTAEIRKLLANPRFNDGIAAALQGDAASQARANIIVIPRLEEIATTNEPRS